MKQLLNYLLSLQLLFILCLGSSCNSSSTSPSKELIDQINLKRGNVISCGAPGKQFGSVDFDINSSKKVQADFNLAIAMLHSFEYDESEKVFARIIDEDPSCAMAYWGVAMCNFHALWTPPTEAELVKGTRAIAIAQSIKNTPQREAGYINALAAFYNNRDKADHHTRCVAYEKAMEKLYADYPNDKEAAIFYALSLDAAADPADKTFAKQKKAGNILNALYKSEPNHPGIIHYIIHTYDYPGLATAALPAARRYAQVAPSSAHALHMPSHIFTRLGLWDECIQSNLASVASAKCYAEQAGIKGHWDEELHGIDYLVYAYLQKGDNDAALQQLKYLQGFTNVTPPNFKVAFAFAAVPARIYLENKDWKEAATVPLMTSFIQWQNFPWQEAMVCFAHVLGAAHTGHKALAETALQRLQQLHDTLVQQKDAYKAKAVAIQLVAGKAWVEFLSGRQQEGLNEMKQAADMEEATEKHPVSPGEVLPARELLGDMYIAAHDYKNALLSYEQSLQRSPNRFNSLYGAGYAAKEAGDEKKAIAYCKQLLAICAVNATRPELGFAKQIAGTNTNR